MPNQKEAKEFKIYDPEKPRYRYFGSFQWVWYDDMHYQSGAKTFIKKDIQNEKQ